MYYELFWRRRKRKGGGGREGGGVVFSGLNENSFAFLECKNG